MIHDLSYVSVRISICFKDIELGIGTAFFYLYEGETYLITNWHNVSGREPDTLKCKHRDAAIPDRLLVTIPYFAPYDDNRLVPIQWDDQIFCLYNDNLDLAPFSISLVRQ